MAQRKTTSTKRKSPAKKAAATKNNTTKSSNVISLKELLKSTDIDPKAARRKLRAAGLSGHDPRARWQFTPAQAKQAKEALGV